MNPICLYCNKESIYVNGNIIYPNRVDLHLKNYYQCKPCEAYVGIHLGTRKAFGTLANKELRMLRVKTHGVFDFLWQNKILKSRTKTYSWLSHSLNIEKKYCHIAMFDKEMCNRAISICEYKINTNNSYPTSLIMWHHFVYIFNEENNKKDFSPTKIKIIQQKINKHKNKYNEILSSKKNL